MSGAVLSSAVGSRSPEKCLERLRTKVTKEFVASLSLPVGGPDPDDSSCSSRRWDAPEIQLLVAAINQVGGLTQYAEIASRLEDRTAYQVAAKVQDLVRSGQLAQTGPGSFALR